MSRTNVESGTIRVAVVQTSSGSPDLSMALEKALALIEEAAAKGAQLVCLGETFLPGYPAWLDYCSGAALWNHPPVKEVFAHLRANSVVFLERRPLHLRKRRDGCGLASS